MRFFSLSMVTKPRSEARAFEVTHSRRVVMPETVALSRFALLLVLVLLLAATPFAATTSTPGTSHAHSEISTNGPVLYLPTADASALASGDADRTVRDAFLGPDAPGAMLVRGVPGYKDARLAALGALAACAASESGKQAFVQAEGWSDEHGAGEFTKHSIGAYSDGRLPSAIDQACGPALRPKLEQLRAAADAAAASVLPRLDSLLGYDTHGFFSNAIESNGSLDHFHVYARGEESEGSETSSKSDDNSSNDDLNESKSDPHVAGKSEHVDVGVAIVMTPALLWTGDTEELNAFSHRGLSLSGKHPELPPDSILVMLGEAVKVWVPPAPEGTDAPQIAVPSHELSLELEQEFGGRAWFGRMVMPADDLVHPTSSMTFGEWREGAAEVFFGGNDDEKRKAMLASIGCSPRRKLADDDSCGAGKIYCWQTCVDDTANCGDGETSKCVEPGTGLVWPDDLGEGSHCYDCAPQCVADPISNETSSTTGRAGGSTNSFCNDKIAPVSMYMDGFLGWADPDGPCVAFLHRDLILSSPGLLFLAFFATIAMGVSVEGLAAARRWRAKTQDAVCLDAMATGGHPVAVSMALKTQSLLLYGIQCSAGYLLMLVSMTYHAVLFIGVVVGLVIGHAWFNAAAPLGSRGGASACCQHVGTLAEEETTNVDGDGARDLDDDLNDTSGGSGDDGSSLNKDLLSKRRVGRVVEMTQGPDRV